MEVKVTCPLGSECETAKDGRLERCAWYTQMAGLTPDGEQVNEWKCAMAWMPILMTENAKQIRSMTAATESFRNESVKGQTEFNQLISAAVTQSKKRLNG